MKQILSFFLLSFCLAHVAHAAKTPPQKIKQITEPLVKEFIDYLASDEMRGRSAPSLELDLSADYIAEKLKEFGVDPVEGSYFQSIPFCQADLTVDACRFRLTNEDIIKDFRLKDNFTPLLNTGIGEVKGGLVFVGYGITAKELDYDDYRDLDVRGKIVLVMKQAPGRKDENSVFYGSKGDPYIDIDYKIRNAVRQGASGFLLVTDPVDNIAITAQGYLWNSLYAKGKGSPTYELCSGEDNAIPAVQVDRKVINAIFGSVDSLRVLQKKIDGSLKPCSFAVEKAIVDLAVSMDNKTFPSSNVIGWIEGKDPELKNEYVVVGAHYDHIGVSDRPNALNDSIMNGADDNASGVAAVMAMAKAFASEPKKPDRSILFLFFTAEERGLIGSHYYVKNPLFPLEKTLAMINLDMVGRNGPDTLYVVGEKYNPELTELVQAKFPESGLQKEEMSMELYQSSDYYPFYKKGISALGFTSGLHGDYHRASDNPDLINHEKVRKTAQLAYRVVWDIANTDNYFTIIESSKLKDHEH